VFRLIWWCLTAMCAVSAQADVAVVLNSNDHDISFIDTTTYRQIKRVSYGKEPHHLMITPDQRHLLVGHTASNDLVAIDPVTGALIKRIPRIADPYQMGFSPDGRFFVVAGLRLDRVDVYHYKDLGFTLLKQFDLPSKPSHLAFAGHTVFVSIQDSDRLVAIDLETLKLLWNVQVGKTPAGVWVTPDRKHVLIGITGEDFVQVVDASDGKTVDRIRTGKGAHNFLAKGDGRHVFVSNRVADTVSLLDQQTMKVVYSFPVPGGPDDMELKKDGSELWVTSRWRNRVSVVDLRSKKIIQSIKVGRSPHGIYFHDHAARM